MGQLITEYQAHGGSVNTSTTPKVQYTYSEMASGANHSRLTSMTYPNGRVLTYSYGSGLNDSISRLNDLTESSGSVTDESYTHMGLGTVVERKHPLPTSPASSLDLSYITSSTGDAGDTVGGLDRFGRIVDQKWTVGSTVKDDHTEFVGGDARGFDGWAQNVRKYATTLTAKVPLKKLAWATARRNYWKDRTRVLPGHELRVK